MHDDYLRIKLIREYPNHIVEGLASNNLGLYQLVRKIANDNDLSIPEQLKKLGFEYKRATRINQVSIDSIKIDLERKFPDKKISRNSLDNHFYYLLRDLAKNSDMMPIEFIISLGFEWVSTHEEYFDSETAKYLKNNFNYTYADFGRFLSLSRERIRQKINKESRNSFSWRNRDLEELEKEFIYLMIESKQTTFSDDSLTIIIINNLNNDICILLKNLSEVKCYINNEIPQDIYDDLLAEKFHCYSDEDFYIQSGVNKVVQEGVLIEFPSEELRRRFNLRKQQLNMKNTEYALFLGFDGIVDARRLDFSQILSKYIVNDNVVYLPVTAPDYQRILSKASRQGKSISDFVEEYGFIKTGRDYELHSLEIMLQYFDELKQYVVEENKVYVPSESGLYFNMASFARRRGITINQLIDELGYIRIFKDDVPLKFEEYEDSLIEISIEQIENILDKLDKIQLQVETETIQDEKLKRNRLLVNELKKMYGYKCQLCSTEQGIPMIEKEDGSYYVEVHHIVHMAQLNTTDEENNIDHYKNMIVVCPFHHKALHHHHGGFGVMERDSDDNVYFVSSKGSKMRVYRNYHL